MFPENFNMSDKLAAHFLICDQNELFTDYNDIEYVGQPEEYYISESLKVMSAINYLSNNLQEDLCETEIASIVYDAARIYDPNDIKGFFRRLYQLLFYSNMGPRMPTFIKIYGVTNFFELLQKKLNNPSKF